MHLRTVQLTTLFNRNNIILLLSQKCYVRLKQIYYYRRDGYVSPRIFNY